jgi:hypothetical protein
VAFLILIGVGIVLWRDRLRAAFSFELFAFQNGTKAASCPSRYVMPERVQHLLQGPKLIVLK